MKKNRQRRFLQNEKRALEIYNTILKRVVYPVLGKNITFGSDLNNFSKGLFGSKFKDVFMRDRIPNLSKSVPYAIINLDSTNQRGSH